MNVLPHNSPEALKRNNFLYLISAYLSDDRSSSNAGGDMENNGK